MNHILKHIWRVLFLVCVFGLNGKAEARNYYFRHIDSRAGLSQNTVYKIIQDGNGFMWFATKEGLNRYDGSTFYRVETPPGEVRLGLVTTLMEDSRGKIWIGSDEGVAIYDPVNESAEWFSLVTPEGQSMKGTVYDMTETPDGNIYISVGDKGLFEYTPGDDNVRLVLKTGNNGLKNIGCILSLDGTLFLGTIGSGLWVAEKGFTDLRKITSPGDETGFDNAVITSLELQGGKLYVSSGEHGILSLDLSDGKLLPVLTEIDGKPLPDVHDLAFKGCSDLFIATVKGIYEYDIKEGKIGRHLKHDISDWYSLSDDEVNTLYFDRDGGLWAGTYFGGVDYHGGSKMQFDKFYPTSSPGSLKAERIRTIVEGPDGKIYVGTHDNGIGVLDPVTKFFTPVKALEGTDVHGILPMGDEIWAGVYGKGVVAVDLADGKTRILDDTNNYTLMRASDGKIYSATNRGLRVFDGAQGKFIPVEGVENMVIYDIFEDSRGNLWASTYNNGLYMRPAKSQKWIDFKFKKGDESSLPHNMVYGVQEDDSGNIWVMTQNGLAVFKGIKEGFDRNYLNTGSIPTTVYRMEEDPAGKYWFSTSNGLYCLDPSTELFRNYTLGDGLPTDQFNFFSSLRASDGTLYFGTTEGMVSFNPIKFSAFQLPETPPVATALYVNGALERPGEGDSVLKESISITKELKLKHWQNNIGLMLSTLSYSQPGSRLIKYRLKGYDSEWQFAKPDDALIVYSNLPSGSYLFEAALTADNGAATGPLLTLKIVVETPAARSWWAIVLYIIGGILVIAVSYFYYRKYILLKRRREMDNFKHEKEKELFDSKINFFTNVAHEIRTPLALIKAPLSTVMTSGNMKEDPEVKDNLDVIDLNVDRLLLLVDQLLDFRKIDNGSVKLSRTVCDVKKVVEDMIQRFTPTLESAHRRLELDLPEGALEAAVDIDALNKILSNLLSNAIKYGKTYIKIRIAVEREVFRIFIVNDGKPVASKDREHIFGIFNRLDDGVRGAGIGLAYARSLANLHGGSLIMGDDTDVNEFVLTLPYGEPDTVAGQSRETAEIEDEIISETPSKVSVLLVEDNPEMLGFLQKRFIARNYNVYIASDGEEALKVLENNYVDIIVSDVMMPGMDGVELLKRVKEDVRHSHIPVVLLTAKTRMEDKLSGLEAGAEAYVEKPFDMEYLFATVTSLLANRERMRLRYESIPIASPPPAGMSKVDEEFLRRINSIIQENFENPGFSMEDVIKEVGMSRTSFYRKIKGLLDLNPNDYIKLQRLKVAAQLFNDGHTSVSEVCYKVGFSSPGYFTKCFQKQFGVSPKEYISTVH